MMKIIIMLYYVVGHENIICVFILSDCTSLLKWECGKHFLFVLLPTLCEWHIQDSVFRSHAYPTHITTIYVTIKFLQYKEWVNRQRNTIANLAENQLKDAIKQKNKSSQEILLHLLNQIKSINTKIDNIDTNSKAVPNLCAPHKPTNNNSI